MRAYESDVLAWSEEQASLLRRLAAGEPITGGELDWVNIIDEIESVGGEQLHAVQSLLVQAMIHLLKLRAWPDAQDADNWRTETAVFLGDARRRFAPSMRRRLELAELYADALKALPRTIGGKPPLPVPAECPFSLDELLG
jgi:hypothetical protein